MKKTLFVISILLGASVLLIAQEPKENKKKVYKAEDDKLYVNKKLGIYLWLSTSPDEQSEKIRLVSDSSHRYTNPMYFDTEGYNTVRSPWAVDTTTKRIIYPLQDVIFEVYADGIAPVSQASYKSNVNRMIEGKKYYGSDLVISIKSRDGVSGVQSTYYQLNNITDSKYVDELKGFKEGENTLKYYAIDRVGNIEKMKDEKFYIDKTAPKTVYTIEGNKNEKYVSANAKIKLESTDGLAGVKAIYYRVNNGTYRRYYNPIPVTIIKSDEDAISFYAEDNLGNKEKPQTIGAKNSSIKIEGETGSRENVVFEFYIDRDPPVISMDISGDSYTGKYTYISGRTKINITAEDEKAGVEKIQYSINSNVIDLEYTEAVSFENEGLQYVRAKATDYVGNTSPVLTKSYYGDLKSPLSTLNVGAPKFSSRDTLFISSKSKISIKATDNLSGTANILLTLNQEDQGDYQEPFFLEKPGPHKISYQAVDRVNNKEPVQILELYVDNLPPVINYNFSVESIGNKTVRDDIYTIFPTNVMLYLSATDARSGSDRIEYSINGGANQTTNPVKGFTPGNYSIEVKAYDVLGNQSSEVIKFAIEK